tara:strand:- start:41 stop:448 length:408 start_codon:yes stop_codon:yes gene_type:complete
MDKDKMMRTNVLIEHIREYDGYVDHYYKKIYRQFEKYIEQDDRVLDTQIFDDMQRDFINLVSFIDKRNSHESALIARLFGPDQNKRRALNYFFADSWDEGNRFLKDSDRDCLDKVPFCRYSIRKAIKELQDLPQE